MNLLINAGESIKHTGEVALILDQISIKTELQFPYNQNLDEGSYYILTVTDTGAGIKNEDLAHIFTPFYTTKSTGTGFGLSQALSILRAHKGAIQVKTQLGQGTEFSIYLPAIS
jgi:signal transduction histidine kinase